MLMTRSQLTFKEWSARQGPALTAVIALHGKGGDIGQLTPLCAVLDPRCRVVAPQAAHARAAPDGYSWYQSETIERPEARSFASAVWQVEQLARDVMERRTPGELRPLLVGYDQGGVLALTVANRLAETLIGVVAIAGGIAEPVGGTLRSADLTGLPILLVSDPAEIRLTRAQVRANASTLKEQGAVVDLIEVEAVASNPLAAAKSVREWTDACLAASFRTDFRWEIGL